MSWTPLHVHTEMSNASLAFADSLNRVEEVIDYAIELNLNGIAITDHESLSAHVRAEQHLDKLREKAQTEEEKEYLKNFKLIKGNEIYLARDDMSAQTYKSGDHFYHFILLALDEIGFEQLRKLSTRAWNRSFYRGIQRRFNFISDLQEIIGSNPGHVVGTTACIGGITGTYFLNSIALSEEQKREQIESFILLFEDIFGKDNFFIELAPSKANKDQEAYNNFMYKHYYGKHNFIITTDAHYLKKEDFSVFKVFLNSKSSKDREVEDFYNTTYIMDWNELQSFFTGWNSSFLQECQDNCNNIAAKAQDYRLDAPVKIPQIQFNYKNERPNFKLDIQKYDVDTFAIGSDWEGKFDYLNEYCDVLENEPLALHTTYKVGGKARYFVYPKNEIALMRLLKETKENQIKTKIIGKGSNLLVSDDDYDGMVICLDRYFNEVIFEKNKNNVMQKM